MSIGSILLSKAPKETLEIRAPTAVLQSQMVMYSFNVVRFGKNVMFDKVKLITFF